MPFVEGFVPYREETRFSNYTPGHYATDVESNRFFYMKILKYYIHLYGVASITGTNGRN